LPVPDIGGHAEGDIFAFAGGGFRGSAAGLELAEPVTGMAAAPGGGLLGSGGDGASSPSRRPSSMVRRRLHLGPPFVGMGGDPPTRRLLAGIRERHICTFGDAMFFGSLAGHVTDIVGISATKGRPGYCWCRERQHLTFGDARGLRGPSAGR